MDPFAHPVEKSEQAPLDLLLAGVVCVALAALSFLAVLVDNDLSIHSWPTSEELPVDGRPHRFDVPAHQATMVWTYDGDATTCRFLDSDTSRPLRLTPSDRGYLRPAGANNYLGTHIFDAGTGHVTARCTGEAAASPVYLERAPRLPALLDGLGVAGLVPLALLLAGGLLVVLAAIGHRRARSPRGSPTAGASRL